MLVIEILCPLIMFVNKIMALNYIAGFIGISIFGIILGYAPSIVTAIIGALVGYGSYFLLISAIDTLFSICPVG